MLLGDLRTVLSLFAKEKRLIGAYLVGAVASPILKNSIPFTIGLLIDLGVMAHDLRNIIIFGAILTALICIANVQLFIAILQGVYLQSKVLFGIRLDLLEKTLRFTPDQYRQLGTGEILQTYGRDVASFQDVLDKAVGRRLRVLVSFAAALGFGIITGKHMVLIPAVFVPLQLFVVGRIKGPVGQIVRKQRDFDGLFSKFVVQALAGHRETRIYGAQRVILSKYNRLYKQLCTLSNRAVGIKYIDGAVSSVLDFLLELAILGVGILQYRLGLASFGQFWAGRSYVHSLVRSTKDLFRLAIDIQPMLVSAHKVRDFIALPHERPYHVPRIRRAAACPAAVRESSSTAIRLCDLTHSYDGQRKVLDGVSLTIPTGACVAFVGESGCGKTTLMNMLTGLVPCSPSSVFVHGHDVAKTHPSDIRWFFGVASHNPFIMSGSIAENIYLGRGLIGRHGAMEQITTCLNLDNEIGALPQSFDTEAGSEGVYLSGGQSQRIALLRAIARNPPILLLDEITSALDAANQQAVRRVLGELKGRCTIVLVTHDISLLDNCDTIYRMVDGTIAA